VNERPAGRRLDDESAVSVRDMVLDHDGKIDKLIAWQNEIRGALNLMKVAFGASILSAIVSILAVVQMMGLRS
jgi:hypothetical protein